MPRAEQRKVPLIPQGCKTMRAVAIVIAVTAWLHLLIAILLFVFAGLTYDVVVRSTNTATRFLLSSVVYHWRTPHHYG